MVSGAVAVNRIGMSHSQFTYSFPSLPLKTKRSITWHEQTDVLVKVLVDRNVHPWLLLASASPIISTKFEHNDH